VDINKENIDFCKNRFSNESKIRYVVCSGSDFGEIDTDSITSIFTYDAMVHFEMLDIISYLKDAYRILIPGGRLLFHHSNAAFNPGVHYNQKPHWRNFMSADIFAHLAMRMGFSILSQDIMSWGGGDNFSEALDCLSFCQK
jgi:ubiquinone/menaquinone biosynthesis C-methylase UbiE